MKNNKIIAALASGLLASGSASAATMFTASKGLQSNGFERPTGVGKFGGSDFKLSGYVIFSTQEILTTESLVLGDLASTEFILSFGTTSNVDLADSGSFVVDYLGSFANVADITTTNGFWNGTLSGSSSVQKIDTGIADAAGSGQSIDATPFTLSGVSEADSANDYVAFRFTYSADLADIPSNTNQELGGFTLNAVPEPSSTALLGLAGLALILRRRK